MGSGGRSRGGDLDVFIACAARDRRPAPRVDTHGSRFRRCRSISPRWSRPRTPRSCCRRCRTAWSVRRRCCPRWPRPRPLVDLVANCARLARAARAAGIPVVHCTAETRDDRKGANHNARLFLGVQKAPAAAVAGERRGAGSGRDRRGAGRHRAGALPRARPDDRHPARPDPAQSRCRDDRRRRRLAQRRA